jgi:hypothetical protein
MENELPLNPMQPYIDHIRSMGVTGRIVVWCSASDGGFSGTYQNWTAFVGDDEMQFSAEPTFSSLVEKIESSYIAAKSFDAIALGM